MLKLSPCLPTYICGGQKIPMSPNLSIYLTMQKRKPLAPLCLSQTTSLPLWPLPSSPQKTRFSTTAHHVKVFYPLSRLGRLGNFSLSPSIVEWRGNSELTPSVATHLDPPTLQWTPTDSLWHCPLIPPQALPPRIKFPSLMATLTTLPLPPQTAAQPLTSWPPPQQLSTPKSKPYLPRSRPPPTAHPA